MTDVVWLRRDLRLHDHPAFEAACAATSVVPVFCLDERLLRGRHASGPRTRFLLECLTDLDRSLRRRRSRLVIRRGPPERELPALATEVGARRMHLIADASPFARARDRRVGDALAASGTEVCAHPGAFVVDFPAALRTAGGEPFTVFTPFYRAWLRARRRHVLAASRSFPPVPAVEGGEVPGLVELGLTTEVSAPVPGGEAAGRERMESFLRVGVERYGNTRNAMADDHTSRLSPYLHLGCVSPRELEERLPDGEGPSAFRRQLCWRDFYAQVLIARPANATSEHQARYRGTLRWSGDRERFEAWCQGETGYPIVDAAMRQLRREGWIHNRGRLIVGSFLTKDLGIDWRWGERWFMRWLLDGDEANNNGNWQWIASVGVDPQPVYRRLYNPARQQGRFDAHGVYVRRYVPELAAVPDRYLAEPWTMPREVQERAGCVIGRDYPAPIVDHALARREALERYTTAG